jgi:hypothetical protein
MTDARTWLPGHLPLGAGRSVSLQPRVCGELKVGAGRIAIGDKLLGVGERVRLWAGERVELVNVADSATALYSWDWCDQQPSRVELVRRAFARAMRALGLRARPELQRCGQKAWCLHA